MEKRMILLLRGGWQGMGGPRTREGLMTARVSGRSAAVDQAARSARTLERGYLVRGAGLVSDQ